MRSQAVRKGAGFGIVARIVSIACTLAQVPIALHYLGPEGFGLWMTLTSIAGLLTMGDLGLSLGAKTLLAQAHGRDDPLALRALADECLRQILPLGLALAGIGALLAWLVDWRGLLGVTSPVLASQLPWALTGLALAAGAALPAALGLTLAAAVQLPWFQHLASALSSALTLVVVVACAGLGWSWLVLVLCALMLPALINGSLWLMMRRRLQWHGPSPARPGPAERAELLRLSRWFFIPQAGSLFAVMSVPVIIAATGGPVAVTAFNLLQRIFGLVSQLHLMALVALWPAYSEAHARKDYPWMREAYRQSWRATLLVFVPGLVVLALIMPWLVQLWVGQSPAGLSPALTAFTAGLFALQLLGQPPAMLLNGLGLVRGVAIYGTVGHLVSLGCMIVGGRLYGVPGVVAGMAAGYLIVGLPGILIQTAHTLKKIPG